MNASAGVGALTRLALRRDRIMLPGWVLGTVFLVASSAAATVDLYPTVQSRVQMASSSNGTTALVAMYGRVYDPTSLGSVSMLKVNIMGAIAAAAMSIILMVRHTRAEEESGRLELVGATAVGRRAPLLSAVLVLVSANTLLALLAALALTASGLDAAGSAAAGAAWGGVGLAFGAIAAVVAQLTEHARTATGYSFAALGGFYLLRALGDTADPDGARWLSWLSPVGWGQQFRPYAGDRWWVLLIMLAFAGALTALAFALVSRRDLGAGLLPDRPGRAAASRWLTGPVSLTWRLQRGSLIGWALGFAVLGAAVGGIAGNVGDMVGSDQARDFITKLGGQKGLTDAFLATEMGVAGVVTAAFGVQAILRLRAEETGQRAEPALASAVSRWRWAGGPLLVALVGSAVLLLAAGLVAGLFFSAQSDDSGQFGRVLAAALVQLPAVWVVIGLTLALYGLLPRYAVAGWVALVVFLLVGEFGALFELPEAATKLSPFAHTPRLPGADVSLTPLLGMLAVAAALIAVGLYGFRRRDITA